MEKLKNDFFVGYMNLICPKPGRNQKEIKASIDLLQTIVHIVRQSINQVFHR